MLARNSQKLDPECLVAQRLKRLSSIDSKLSRFKNMKLSQMQDIAGCRAVVNTTECVYRLVDLYKKSQIKHKLHEEYDYIANPKPSGYRSVHMIYRYYSDRKTTYNDLRIEIQLRSRLQHAWATAVEVVGAFTKQALKASRGEEDWLRFFLLMSADIAAREKTSSVPNTPESPKKLKEELRTYIKGLDVFNRLQAYRAMVAPPPDITGKNPHYFLVSLDLNQHTVTLKTFKMRELPQATNEYLREEKLAGSSRDVVLVSVDSVDALKKAYPNYFLDTDVFISAVKKAIS